MTRELKKRIILKRKIFGSANGIGGGVGTLFLRVAKYCIENDIDAVIVTQKICVQAQEMLKNNGVPVMIINQNADFDESIRSICLDDHSETHIICTEFREFLDIQERVYDLEHVFVLIYSVVPSTFYNSAANMSLFRRVIELVFKRPIIRRAIDYQAVLFMDNECLNTTANYFHLKCGNDLVQFLPFDSCIFQKNKFELFPCSILTVSRAEFSFKGYLLGLLEAFQNISADYNDVTLTIVSYGTDIELLKQKINCLPPTAKKKITLVGQTDYRTLMQYYENATVYVGMGTTLLEAANYEIPAIKVLPHTYEFQTSGFFVQDPFFLAARGNTYDGEALIRELLDSDNDSYRDLCIASKAVLDQYYSMKTTVNTMLAMGVNNKRILNLPNRIERYLWDKIRSIYLPNKDKR